MRTRLVVAILLLFWQMQTVAQSLGEHSLPKQLSLGRVGIYDLEFCGKKDAQLLVTGGRSEDDVAPMFIKLIELSTTNISDKVELSLTDMLIATKNLSKPEVVYLTSLDESVWEYNTSTLEFSLCRGLNGTVTHIADSGSIVTLSRNNEVKTVDKNGVLSASYQFAGDPNWGVIACPDSPAKVFAHYKGNSRVLVTRFSDDFSRKIWSYENDSSIREIAYLPLQTDSIVIADEVGGLTLLNLNDGKKISRIVPKTRESRLSSISQLWSKDYIGVVSIAGEAAVISTKNGDVVDTLHRNGAQHIIASAHRRDICITVFDDSHRTYSIYIYHYDSE